MLCSHLVRAAAFAAVLLGAGVAVAQTPESLSVHFELGSSRLRAEDEAVLDQASRLYRDGQPIVMMLTGSTDTVGQPESNLILAQERNAAVLRGLTARGIPADRFRLVAKGEAEPAVATPDGVSDPRNRKVEITWR